MFGHTNQKPQAPWVNQDKFMMGKFFGEVPGEEIRFLCLQGYFFLRNFEFLIEVKGAASDLVYD